MRWFLFLVLLAGCLGEASDDLPEDAPEGPEPDDAGAPMEEVPVAWSKRIPLAFTMAVSGEVPQSGSNCVADTFEGLSSMWANASWEPAVDLRLVVARDGGGRILADETGPSPLHVELPAAATGDGHYTVALLAPENGTAPQIDAVLDLEGVAAGEPDPGTMQCAF